MYKTGQIKEKIDEERLKMFLEQIGGVKKKAKIIVLLRFRFCENYLFIYYRDYFNSLFIGVYGKGDFWEMVYLTVEGTFARFCRCFGRVWVNF